MKSTVRKLRVVVYNMAGVGSVLLATPAFGFQGGLVGTPGDTLLHTITQYAAGPLVAGGSVLSLIIGAVSHGVSKGERGHGWLWAGAICGAVGATARFVPPLLGLAWTP